MSEIQVLPVGAEIVEEVGGEARSPIGLPVALSAEHVPRITDEMRPEERREMAYRGFAQLTRKHSRGWCQRLSQLTGVRCSVLSRWRRNHEWDLRFAGEMASLHADLERTAQAVLFAGAGRVAERIMDVIESGTDRDAIAGAKLWSEMTGVTVRKPTQPVTINQNVLVAGEKVTSYQNLSDAELFGVAKEQTQQQLDHSLAIRSGRKKV